jgi:hypothetical protein
VGVVPIWVGFDLTGRGELVPKLVWREAELEPGLTTEVEVARLEPDHQADVANLGLRLAEAKQLTAGHRQVEGGPSRDLGDQAASAMVKSALAIRSNRCPNPAPTEPL